MTSTPDPQLVPIPVVDDGTYSAILESRSPNRLIIEPNVWQLISSVLVLAFVVAIALVFSLLLGQAWIWIPAGIFIVLSLWTMAILPRQARAYGYQLRQDDLVFRKGILWQRVVAVPYGRMQLIDITHGPLDRGFGIAQLKFVTAAATSNVLIPGLPQATAESLRDHLIAVAESRRTGL